MAIRKRYDAAGQVERYDDGRGPCFMCNDTGMSLAPYHDMFQRCSCPACRCKSCQAEPHGKHGADAINEEPEVH